VGYIAALLHIQRLAQLADNIQGAVDETGLGRDISSLLGLLGFVQELDGPFIKQHYQAPLINGRHLGLAVLAGSIGIHDFIPCR
jgi:hypothetical protein